MKRTTLREIAHSRSGEKGNHSNVSVIAYELADYPILLQQVTVAAVEKLYGPITKGSITRYEVPSIGALNFVLEDVLEGGRSRTLAFEESGKALSSLMMTMPMSVSDSYIERSTHMLKKDTQ
ncbi:hypothetical protein [Burkholderia sp. L27(2015)]|uniref:AtuA-related protein n=1 Tax=Burkholderia sp. L27(2015) TaxID=1641858 RepID=UPI0020B1228F|nr:hypothetical protein [Burkholderia sp. L27(2015)]